jgi:hypothetical protein
VCGYKLLILVQCGSPKETCIVNAYCQFSQQARTNFMQTYLHWSILTFFLYKQSICIETNFFFGHFFKTSIYFNIYLDFKLYQKSLLSKNLLNSYNQYSYATTEVMLDYLYSYPAVKRYLLNWVDINIV